jgi:NAD-dependent SIR2 family protein deacetylase
MITEFDLPCSKCGGQLKQVSGSVDDRVDEISGTISLAECVDCGAQYYPKQALDRI